MTDWSGVWFSIFTCIHIEQGARIASISSFAGQINCKIETATGRCANSHSSCVGLETEHL